LVIKKAKTGFLPPFNGKVLTVVIKFGKGSTMKKAVLVLFGILFLGSVQITLADEVVVDHHDDHKVIVVKHHHHHHHVVKKVIVVHHDDGH
jgi:hypothetical protein